MLVVGFPQAVVLVPSACLGAVRMAPVASMRSLKRVVSMEVFMGIPSPSVIARWRRQVSGILICVPGWHSRGLASWSLEILPPLRISVVRRGIALGRQGITRFKNLRSMAGISGVFLP